METSLKLVRQLVADFQANEKKYLSSEYSEAQVRNDYIDKFFFALGWDVNHNEQKNPHEQEVKIENNVKMPGTQRRADYAFFTAPNFRDVKFFVEAKKPVRNLSNPDDYYQAMRYGWNAGTPLAILTDFEEFHVIDCRYKPDIADALNRKILYFHYTDYAKEEKFAEIFYLFGRDAVAGGSIEKYIASKLPKPRGKAIQGGLFKGGYKTVDEDFLEALDGYRNTLAKAFKKVNQELDGEELTEAVQRTLDRLVFIRFLEDKGIEEKEIIGLYEKASAWKAFIALCKRLEPKYNGLIFKPHRILDGDSFRAPDDRAFADICAELADPSSPYDFDKIPISILGSIYERFLGKVVHATAKQAKVEEKPEVRKAGGVYYTPEYIVRYIVKETVGKLIEEKTPDEIAKMTFADIACGSGSFLIEVYGQLLDYHERWYNTHKENIKKDDVFERDGHLHLTLKKKKEILTNNVYGVDIDFQATEVTQLSLYLRMLENVTTYEAHQQEMFKEQILPNLNKNIICGNSLIGTNIYDGDLFQSHTLPLNGGEHKRGSDEDKLKPMNFEDVFPQVMKKGGFDAIVGNPPYGADFGKIEKDYIKNKFTTFKYRYDSYIYFIEKALSVLKKNGRLGYITPELWLKLENCDSLRLYISQNSSINKIRICGENVFAQAVVNTIVFLLSKENVQDDIVLENETESWTITKADWKSAEGLVIDYRLRKQSRHLIDKIKNNSIPLSTFGDSIQGITPYDKYRGHSQKLIKNREFHSKEKIDSTYGKWLEGKDVGRFQLGWSGEWLKYGEWLGAPREPKFFKNERILFREVPGINKRIQATIATETLYHGHSITPFILNPTSQISLKFLLGIANSRLISWYAGLMLPNFGKDVFPKLNPQDVKAIPVVKLNFENNQDKSRHDTIVKLVEQMLDTKQKLASARTDAETNRLELLCQSLDRKIDEAVYELYGLTEEEIKVVEGKE